MSLESSRSLSRTPPPRKRSYPLKMETIPMSSSYDELKGVQEPVASREETEYGGPKPRASSFEADDDFKFKRHKNKQSNGVPSLGERLDNLQDIKKARWVDNFNSSMPNGREMMPNGREMMPNGREMMPNGGSSPGLRTQDQSQPYSQVHQGSAGLQGAPYMPYMYYYPVPPQGPPMVPFVGSPMHPAQVEGGQYMNSSHSVMPNSSLQPFFPPLPQQPRYDNGSSQLLPPATFYPYNVVQSQQQQSKKMNDRRKSITTNRGRRLSLLASQNDQHGIISPHKDVPEQDFHRHIGDTSFGKGLQMRQLFNWCIIRALRNLEKGEVGNQQTAGNSEDKYVDPTRIALSILKEFVNDLRKGAIDVDWEAEEEASGDEEVGTTGEDTELRELFEEDEETGKNNEKSNRRRARSKGSRSERPKIPNSKNVQNEKNLEALESRISSIKEEIQSWAEVLSTQKPESEWETMNQDVASTSEEPAVIEAIDYTVEDVYDDLSQRLDKLQVHSHLLDSSSQALSSLIKGRQGKLWQDFASTLNHNARSIDSKALLRGLSKSIAQ